MAKNQKLKIKRSIKRGKSAKPKDVDKIIREKISKQPKGKYKKKLNLSESLKDLESKRKSIKE